MEQKSLTQKPSDFVLSGRMFIEKALVLVFGYTRKSADCLDLMNGDLRILTNYAAFHNGARYNVERTKYE